MVTGDLPSGTVYVVAFSGYHKIGRTNNLDRRLKGLLPVAFPVQPALRYSFDVPNAAMVERGLHAHFASQRVRGEWFLLTEDELLTIPDFVERFDYSTNPRHRRPVLAEEAERHYIFALAQQQPIHRLPKLLRKLKPGKSLRVATTNIAAIRSIERKFGYKLMILPNDTDTCIVKVRNF